MLVLLVFVFALAQVTVPLPPDVDRIAFPEGVREPAPCSNNKTICEDEGGYPHAALTAVLQRDAQRFSGLFETVETVPQADFASRNGMDDEEPMCDVVHTWPKATRALGVDEKWMWIVQGQDQKVQKIKLEECSVSDGECRYAKSFSRNLRTHCRQVYTFVKMLGATVDRGSLKVDFMLAKVPSCCQCKVSSMG